MSNDKRPDSRFAMIAEEMTIEVKATVVVDLTPSEPQLVVSEDSIQCPRCGNRAFEPKKSDQDVPAVRCLACPQQIAAWYPLPAGLKLVTNRYRCSGCGVQRQVTMTMSDVNLQCVVCRMLTLHSIQVEEAPSRSPALRDAYGWTQSPKFSTGSGNSFGKTFNYDDALIKTKIEAEAEEQTKLKALANAARQSLAKAINDDRDREGEARRRPRVVVPKLFPNPVDDFEDDFENDSAKPDMESSVVVDGVNDVYVPRNDRMLVELTKTMTSILDLQDFDAHARRRREENFRNGVKDVTRRTGRTWRGIVELLARYYLSSTRPTVWVVGGSERMDAWLRNEVLTLRDRLGNKFPDQVSARVPVEKLIERKLKPPAGVMLYVDHTFYERRTNGSFRGGIEYKP